MCTRPQQVSVERAVGVCGRGYKTRHIMFTLKADAGVHYSGPMLWSHPAVSPSTQPSAHPLPTHHSQPRPPLIVLTLTPILMIQRQRACTSRSFNRRGHALFNRWISALIEPLGSEHLLPRRWMDNFNSGTNSVRHRAAERLIGDRWTFHGHNYTQSS